MSRSLMLIVLGSLIAVLPFSGVPFTYISWVFTVLGVFVLILGISYRQQSTSRNRHEEPTA